MNGVCRVEALTKLFTVSIGQELVNTSAGENGNTSNVAMDIERKPKVGAPSSTPRLAAIVVRAHAEATRGLRRMHVAMKGLREFS